MKGLVCKCATILATAALLVSASSAWALDTADWPDTPLYHGGYVAPMFSFLLPSASKLDHGLGGTFAGGWRNGWYAFEAGAIYSNVDAKGNAHARELGGTIDALVFPLSSLPNLYGIGEFGAFQLKDYPGQYTPGAGRPVPSNVKPVLVTYGAGLGYLLDLSFGRYEFGVRAEALYRYGDRSTDAKPRADPNIPKAFNDVLLNVGLQLPLSLKKPPDNTPPPAVTPPPPPPPPDSDGDGVTDNLDQCPGTPHGTQVDAKGCPLPPPCKPPAPGERISLAGCGTGDVIVLRGVNFEFDKANLTVNAKTILSDVSAELKKYPDIHVEIGGYTDSKGSDAYNQKLSQRRAESVKKYFLTQGITADRLTAVGYGEANPVADNKTDEGRELNRRVELKITGGSGVAPTQSAPAAQGVPEPAAPASVSSAAPQDSGSSASANSPAAPVSPSSSGGALGNILSN